VSESVGQSVMVKWWWGYWLTGDMVFWTIFGKQG